MVNLGNGCFMRMHWRNGGGSKGANAPSGNVFLGGGTLGKLFYLSNIHTYLYVVVYTNSEHIAVILHKY